MIIDNVLIDLEDKNNFKDKYREKINILNFCILKNDTWKEAINRIVNLISRIDKDFYFWSRTVSYFQPNSVQNYKKLWKSDQMVWYNSDKVSENYLHSDNRGKFYSGVGHIFKNDLGDLFEYARIVGKDYAIVFASDLFVLDNAVENDNKIVSFKNYYDIVNEFCNDNVIFKIDGNFDDVYLNVEMFYDKNDLKTNIFVESLFGGK